MGDLVFVAVVVAFFAVTVAYVRACERIVGRETGTGSSADADAGGALNPARRHRRSAMSADNVIGLVLAVALTAYLVAALVVPEKL